MRYLRIKNLLLISSLLWLVTACGNSTFSGKGSAKYQGTQKDLDAKEVTIQSLDVIPAEVSLNVGEKHSFKAEAKFSDDTVSDVTSIVSWSSEDDSIGTVDNKDAKGQFSAVKTGKVKIVAEYDKDTKASASITVTNDIQLLRIELDYASQMLLNDEQNIVVMATYSDGSSRDVSAQSAFAPQKTTILEYKPTAIVHSLAAGSDIVDVSYAGKSAEATIEVLAKSLVSIAINPANKSMTVGEEAAFSAIGTFSQGGTIDLTATAQWSSSDATKAGVSDTAPTKGKVTGIAQGNAQITAKYNNLSASATVTVASPTLLRVEISPINPSLKVGQSLSMHAVAFYSDLSSVDVTNTAAWISSLTNTATFSSANKGVVTGVANGSSVLTAAFNGKQASTTLTVSSNSPSCVSFTASKLSAVIGDTVTFTVNIGIGVSSAVINGVQVSSAPYKRDIIMSAAGNNDFNAYVQGSGGRGDCQSLSVVVKPAPTSCVDANASSIITFESNAYAGKPIGSNYPGLTFSLKGLTELPILTTVLHGNEKLGTAETAWLCVACGGENHIAKDTKSSTIAGNYLLTMINGYRRDPLPTLVINYATPVSAAAGYLMDIDHKESWFAKAYNSNNQLVGSWSKAAREAGTGNGIPTYWVVGSKAADIVKIEITGNDPGGVFGFGFDRFSPNAPICNP